MMKKLMLLCSLSLIFFATKATAQEQLPEMNLSKAQLEAHMRFLASDALEGRRTGSRGNDIAAAYIAAQFEAYGLKPAPGKDSYFQPVMFESVIPPQSGSLKLGKTDFERGKDFLFLSGTANNVKTTAVFANYGWVDSKTSYDDYKNLDVKGKVVFVLPGTPDDQSPMAILNAGTAKQKFAAERGAVAVIELFRMQFPWNFFVSYFGKEAIRLADGQSAQAQPNIVYGFFKEPSPNPIKDLEAGKSMKVTLSSTGGSIAKLPSQNVCGVLEGSDPVLKNEYIILSAHYDHVGVGAQGGGAYTAQDSIFNGARDNGFGTISLLAAAKAFYQKRPKRSVIFLAVTGEEQGLLGSQYYAENPLIPLEKTVFNLNTDAAGYNDTDNVMIVGIEHVSVRETLEAGAKPFGLGILDDPMPEQNLFQRSDHYNFVIKGVPSIFMTPAITAFDDKITKYYHQVTDNPDTIDYDYLLKYCQAFVHTARLIGDMPKAPFWKAGDKYEEGGKKLYNK